MPVHARPRRSSLIRRAWFIEKLRLDEWYPTTAVRLFLWRAAREFHYARSCSPCTRPFSSFLLIFLSPSTLRMFFFPLLFSSSLSPGQVSLFLLPELNAAAAGVTLSNYYLFREKMMIFIGIIERKKLRNGTENASHRNFSLQLSKKFLWHNYIIYWRLGKGEVKKDGGGRSREKWIEVIVVRNDSTMEPDSESLMLQRGCNCM